jgi:hypothetical protein
MTSFPWIDILGALGIGLVFCLWLWVKDKEMEKDDDYFNY